MHEIVTRWDWICLGVVIGVLTVKVGELLQRLAHRWIGIHQLERERELLKVVVEMQKQLDGIKTIKKSP